MLCCTYVHSYWMFIIGAFHILCWCLYAWNVFTLKCVSNMKVWLNSRTITLLHVLCTELVSIGYICLKSLTVLWVLCSKFPCLVNCIWSLPWRLVYEDWKWPHQIIRECVPWNITWEIESTLNPKSQECNMKFPNENKVWTTQIQIYITLANLNKPLKTFIHPISRIRWRQNLDWDSWRI